MGGDSTSTGRIVLAALDAQTRLAVQASGARQRCAIAARQRVSGVLIVLGVQTREVMFASAVTWSDGSQETTGAAFACGDTLD